MSYEYGFDPLYELEKCLKDLNSTKIGRRVFLASIPFLMTGCASTEKTRYREGDNTGQDVELNPSEEKKLTAEVLPKMKKEYPPIQNAGLQNYINGLGQKLVRANSLNGKPYRYSFTAVDVPFVNAFALPAGTVFVTAPLIEMASSEAELIGVIGHEVGHIQARHTAERMFQAKRAQSKSWKYAVGGGLIGGLLGFGVGKLACPPKDKKCLQKAATYGALAGAGGGLLIQKYAFMANSREDEMEADRIGFRTAVRTGYHKDYVGRFYEKLLIMEQKSKRGNLPGLGFIQDAMSTHPPSQERVGQMKEMAARETKRAGRVSTKQFDQMKKIATNYAKRARTRAQSKR